jgi:hypothetical protein
MGKDKEGTGDIGDGKTKSKEPKSLFELLDSWEPFEEEIPQVEDLPPEDFEI